MKKWNPKQWLFASKDEEECKDRVICKVDNNIFEYEVTNETNTSITCGTRVFPKLPFSFNQNGEKLYLMDLTFEQIKEFEEIADLRKASIFANLYNFKDPIPWAIILNVITMVLLLIHMI